MQIRKHSHLLAFGLLLLAIPLSAYAALVNINTADAALLDTLPGIGPTYATRIVDYRTAHGPFARIEDIQNVSGIGPSTYANIASLITVGSASASTASSTVSAASSTPASGGATTYVPPPQALSVGVDGSNTALVEVPLRLFAYATMKGGTVDSSAQISWSFGDGSSATGMEVEKVYRYAGTYLVTVTASDGSVRARDEMLITVTTAKIRIAAVTSEGITIANDSSERLDLSGWRLLSEAGSFRIPEGMTILPESRVLFPFSITNLPLASDATLLYPNGVIATHSVAPTSVVSALAADTLVGEQLPADKVSYKQVQEVEPIISVRNAVPEHEEAVVAPAAATELAAAGAALPASSNVLRSPWMLGLVSIMALAGGAFILL
jgi:competence ComEA-like helix-hairpin-helix protein